MYKSGEIAAQMAMDIANGTDSAEINVVKDSPNIYCVDEDVMRKFGLEASQFPKDTEFVNHREGFFARNREALIPAFILIAALNVIICWVCFDNTADESCYRNWSRHVRSWNRHPSMTS